MSKRLIRRPDFYDFDDWRERLIGTVWAARPGAWLDGLWDPVKFYGISSTREYVDANDKVIVEAIWYPVAPILVAHHKGKCYWAMWDDFCAQWSRL